MDNEPEKLILSHQKTLSNAWMISFADLLSLVLTFFIMFYAVSSTDHAKWNNYLRAISYRFNDSAKDIPELDSNFQMIKGERSLDINYLTVILEKKLNEDTAFSDLKLTKYKDKIVLSVHEKVLFKQGGNDLNLKAVSVVYFIANFVSGLNNQLNVVANYMTNEDSNLSLARAIKIASEVNASGYDYPINIFTKKVSVMDIKNFSLTKFDNLIDIEITSNKAKKLKNI